MPQLDRAFGRQAFGDDPGNYDAARPDYPEWVFETLKDRCGLGPGAEVFEIGAGTGKATRRLLEAGANPVVAIEPDARLAAFLTERADSPALRVLNETFEAANLPAGAFDLGVSATAFHWLDEDPALAKIATLLKPGGWWAAVWNVFGDDSRPDPFHDATQRLFEGAPQSPSSGRGEVPFALDEDQRLVALERAGAFEAIERRIEQWPLVLDARQTMALYATYSNVTARADRDWLLSELGRVAETEFGDRVVRNMTTSLYLARRRA
jgi:SAM-dependent methyltransferase